MIRVNLAKTHNYGSTGTQTAIAMDMAAMGPSGVHPAVKIGLMVIFSILLWGYESYIISQKQVELTRLKAQVQQIETEVSQFGSVRAVVDGLAKEKAKLGEQLSVIEKISKKRAFKLQAIMLVQESMLEDLWLDQLIVDQSLIVFKGFSRSPTSVQEIVKNLNDSDFIETAINKELKRVSLANENLNAFDIQATVKN